MAVTIPRTQTPSHLVILWFISNLFWQASLGFGSISEKIAEGIKAQGTICPAKQETVLINKPSKEGSY